MKVYSIQIALAIKHVKLYSTLKVGGIKDTFKVYL